MLIFEHSYFSKLSHVELHWLAKSVHRNTRKLTICPRVLMSLTVSRLFSSSDKFSRHVWLAFLASFCILFLSSSERALYIWLFFLLKADSFDACPLNFTVKQKSYTEKCVICVLYIK